jgi:hypothetical protein
MKKLFFIIISFLSIYSEIHAQGCVAIRSTGGFCTAQSMDHQSAPSPWTLGINNRYYESYKHFIGTEEQKQRVDSGTNVINHSYTLDLILTRMLTRRWSLSFDMPILANSRSSKYEHYGNNSTSPNARQSTHSFGIGDIRLTAYYWLIDPVKSTKGNVQVGLGIKLPTGAYNYQDFFHKNDSVQVLGPVDQSIQLGDGGTGFTTEINAYYNFSHKLSVYGNFYYLLNPREQNGTSTARGGVPSASAIKYGSSTMSVPDQWMLRAGGNFHARSLTISAGVREECLPSTDLVGGSSGFRRPGYIISFEPGITYSFKKVDVYTYVPIALVRNRTQSYSDKKQTEATGKYTQGDAAFADYVVNIGASFRF